MKNQNNKKAIKINRNKRVQVLSIKLKFQKKIKKNIHYKKLRIKIKNYQMSIIKTKVKFKNKRVLYKKVYNFNSFKENIEKFNSFMKNKKRDLRN